MFKIGFGQDSHKFEFQKKKDLILGGIKINYPFGLKGNSDADVILHSTTNAISSITTKPILGLTADKLCLEQNIIDSKVYLKQALDDLNNINYKINHLAISLECSFPKLLSYFLKIRQSVADICQLELNEVGITATTGESLTAFGQGAGINCNVVLTCYNKKNF